jgi:hypothetical protein
MSDIVERLLYHTQPEFFHTPFRQDDTGIIITIGALREAAAEIERLRWFEERYELKCKVIAKQDDEIERLTAALTTANAALAKFCSDQLSHVDTFKILGAAWKETRRALEDKP